MVWGPKTLSLPAAHALSLLTPSFSPLHRNQPGPPAWPPRRHSLLLGVPLLSPGTTIFKLETEAQRGTDTSSG